MKLLIVVISCAVAAFAKHHGSKAAKKAFPFNDSIDGRIVKGQLAKSGQFPWQVGFFSDSNSFCGGALISNEWVLTAAHCIVGKSFFELTLGAIRIYEDDPGTIRMNASESFCHPLFDRPTLDHDVGLIKLADPVTFDELIQKITLAESNSFLDEDVPVKVSGWGKTNRYSGISENLLWVDLTTMANGRCKSWYSGFEIQDNMVCCMGTYAKSTCNGDSGGPLIQCNNDDCIHVGVVSFGHRYGCSSSNKPTAYSRTALAIEFINNVTGLNFP